MQMKVEWVCIAVAIGIFTVTGPAWAADTDTALSAERQQELLASDPTIDANGDGVVTRDEARQYFQSKSGRRSHRSSRSDATGTRSKDGRRGKTGRQGGLMDPAQLLEKYPDADTDKDGKLSRDEMKAFIKSQGGMKAFMLKEHPEWDTNKDGELSSEEMRAARSTTSRPWGQGLGFGQMTTAQRERMAEKLMKEHPEADTDSDGRLSREECQTYLEAHPEIFSQQLLGRFPEADTDGDGVLSQAELDAFKATRSSRSPKRHGRSTSQPAAQSADQ